MTEVNHSPSQQGSASQAKIEANRRNAEKSAGPKTPEGKAGSKGNALKFGLTASQVVIARIDGEDAQKRFDEHYKRLRDYYAPESPIDEFRARRVADNMWRLLRHDRAEAAMLEQASLRAAADALLERSGLDRVLNENIPGTTAATSNSHRLSMLIDRLEQIRDEIQRDRAISANTVTELLKRFADEPAIECAVQWVTAYSTGPDSSDLSSAESLLERVSAMISHKLEQFCSLEKELEQFEEDGRRTAQLASVSLSPGQL